MKKKALITGITGQDGSYLAERLLNLDYDVFGVTRRHSVAENQDARIKYIYQENSGLSSARNFGIKTLLLLVLQADLWSRWNQPRFILSKREFFA